MSDTPRYKDGAVVPPEQVDSEPTLIGEDDLKRAYPDLDADDRALIEELDSD